MKLRPVHSACMMLFAIAVSAAPALAQLHVDVLAGKHDRPASVATYILPDDLAKAEAVWVMYGDPERSSVPMSQRITIDGKPAMAWMIAPMKAGERMSFTLRPGTPVKDRKAYVSVEKTDAALALRVGNQQVLRYNTAIVQPPVEVDKIFARSGYIYPLHSPSGLLVTNDFAPKHLHHHGIWFPWTESQYEGQKVDFWNSKKGEGRVEFVKVENVESGGVLASFRAHHKHVALKVKDAPLTILNETWDVRVYNNDKVRVFDLDSTQTCATDKPLKLLNYYYGGLGLRGSGHWEGDDVQFLTSEGKTRIEGHATKVKWCAMYGKVTGKPCGIAVLCHPSNFRFPQKTRIHPSEPFFNFSPCAEGDFEITPGKPYVSKYRFVTFDGDVDAKLLEQMWNDYAEPVEVKVVK